MNEAVRSPQDGDTTTHEGAVARPPARTERVAFLDVARALAMIGVVMMNVTAVAFTAEMVGERETGTLTSIVDGVLTLIMSGKARAMLMVLLGIGAVLAWRSATRRGGRPLVLMLRRYAVLGVLFGVPHLLVFSGDILTHYSITALFLAPLMPLLLRGSVARPLWTAVGLFAVAPLFEYGLDLGGADLGVLIVLVPQTLGFFCVGVWLARRPELDPDFAGRTRLIGRMIWSGLLMQVMGLVVLFGSDLLFPMRMDADGVPIMTPEGMPVIEPGAQMMTSLSGTFTGMGGALFYLGLVWWLVRRDGRVARALGALTPLGRMTLTVYLASTAVFLVLKPFEGQLPTLAHYALGVTYFVVMALVARWWLGRFRLGPLEWVWRSLVHLRPMPMRRRETGVAETEAVASAPSAGGTGTAA
ncbi:MULTISPECIES: DUF418 domain-containing protein [Nocardiopsis]|nr:MULTISPECIES: DUF418 domain-containing protein [Nocardiopsis]MEC3893717.1 DUF418 domain-containing protein [Nocardiopsis sp. LDBS1602]